MSHFLTFLAGWWFCSWGTCICHTGPRPILAHCTWEAICGACEGYWRNEIIQGIWQTPSWADEHASCWCQAEESSRGWEGRQEVIGLITSRAPFIFLDVDESISFLVWAIHLMNMGTFNLGFMNFVVCMDMLIFIRYWFWFLC